MAKPKFFIMSNIRRMIPPHWNVKIRGTPEEQDYVFYSAFAKDYAFILQVDKKRNNVIVSRENLAYDEETKEVYKSYITLFKTTYTHRSNGLKFIRKTLK